MSFLCTGIFLTHAIRDLMLAASSCMRPTPTRLCSGSTGVEAVHVEALGSAMLDVECMLARSNRHMSP